MPAVISPHDEEGRLATLHALDLLDTAPETPFDTLVELAAEMLDCPVALVTLIDRDRQWVKARTGKINADVCRRDAVCDHTIRGGAPLIVEDLLADRRFRANPLVVSPDGLRFYAGAPIHATGRDGVRHGIGAVCVIDHRPRRLDRAKLAVLQQLATLAEALIASRADTRHAVEIARERERQTAEIAHRERTFRQAERIAQIGSWRYDLGTDRLDLSEGAFRIHGLDPRPISVAQALDHYPPDARARVSAALARTIETGAPFEVEEEFHSARGDRRRIHVIAELDTTDDGPIAITGVLQDVTERHALELQLRRAADTDALTGIANRAAFNRLLDAAIARHRAHGTPLLLVLVDLDGFKLVNDTLGHLAGDDALRQVAAVLATPGLAGGVVARLGGDEFAVVVEDPALCAFPERLRARLGEALRLSVKAGGITMTAAGTVGLAAPGPEPFGARDLMRRADADLYAAKRARVGGGVTRPRRTG